MGLKGLIPAPTPIALLAAIVAAALKTVRLVAHSFLSQSQLKGMGVETSSNDLVRAQLGKADLRFRRIDRQSCSFSRAA